MRISIIISVYNLENYISQCLDSLIEQNFDDYEIILVNDGSTDKSEEICRKYLSNTKVKYYSKLNGGASSARNFGLVKASGDYVIFMDGDDFWDDHNALTFLDQKLLHNPDIVIYGCKDLDEKTGQLTSGRDSYDVKFLENTTKDKLLENLVRQNKLPGAAWLICANKEFLLSNQIIFKEGIKAEDIDWVYSVLHYSKMIRFLNEPFYIYRKNRNNSATFDFDDRSISGVLFTLEKWIPVIKGNRALKALLFNLNFHYLLTVVFAKSLNDEQLSSMNSSKEILKYSSTTRNKILSLFVKVLGIKKSNQLFSYVNHRKS